MVIFGGVVDMKERENETRLELCEGLAQPISHNVDLFATSSSSHMDF